MEPTSRAGRRATPPARPRRLLAGLLAAGLAVTLGACVQSRREAGGARSSTFVFAASSDPVALDPSLANDGETFRISRQIFEGLVGVKPGTADPAPGLAESWTSTPDGLSYTFTLRPGVRFSDGTPFDAAAVCANFERWYDRTGIQQSESLSYYYRTLFRGFRTSANPSLRGGIYQSCAAPDQRTATIRLRSPFAGFIASMSLPALRMQSPAALKKYGADQVGGTEDDPRYSEYATAHPTGTGPFVFASWQRGQQVTLKRNPDYWGDKAKVETVVVKVVSDAKARLQALQNHEIDGYDLVAPGDLEGLRAKGFTILQRPPFNILYLGMNQKKKPLDDIRVRQAIAHAIDKDAVIKQSLPAGSTVAREFVPPTVVGYADDVPVYPHDPAKARALLAAAGQQGLTLTFDYPTGVSRPYMPNPEDTFVALKSQLQAVGIRVKPVALKWSPDYLGRIQDSADHGIHLLGWTGDYNDTDNFVGVFFGAPSSEWGFDSSPLFDALKKARALPAASAVPAYQAINRQIMQFLPGVPLAHPTPSLAFAAGVHGYVPSPVQDEPWNAVTVGGDGVG